MAKLAVASNSIATEIASLASNTSSCYEANKLGVTDKITDMAMNGSSVRDTKGVLRINLTTVIAHLKTRSTNPIPLVFNEASDKTGLERVYEMDEQWSYVGNKSQQHWRWSAWSPHFKQVFAYAFGSWANSTLKTLLDRVKRTLTFACSAPMTGKSMIGCC